MSGIGIGIGLALGASGGIRTQAGKASLVPVSGAVVVAPMWESFANYGSLGGSLTAVGAPSFGSTFGATFNGTDDAAYLVTGTQDDITCVFRAQTTSTAGERCPVGIVAASSAPANQGIAFERYSGTWNALLYGVARVTGTVADDANAHVFTLQRSASGVSLWVDGVLSASTSNAGSASDSLVLAAKNYPFTWANFAACSVKNLAMYHSVLSAGNRALVEAWAR